MKIEVKLISDTNEIRFAEAVNEWISFNADTIYDMVYEPVATQNTVYYTLLITMYIS